MSGDKDIWMKQSELIWLIHPSVDYSYLICDFNINLHCFSYAPFFLIIVNWSSVICFVCITIKTCPREVFIIFPNLFKKKNLFFNKVIAENINRLSDCESDHKL